MFSCTRSLESVDGDSQVASGISDKTGDSDKSANGLLLSMAVEIKQDDVAGKCCE